MVILSERAEVNIIRGQPWYKRSPRILGQDAREAVLRLYQRWKSGEEEQRRIEATRRAIQAVDVVSEYLDDMERQVVVMRALKRSAVIVTVTSARAGRR